MNRHILIITPLLFLTVYACKGEAERAKEQMIERTISEMRIEADTVLKGESYEYNKTSATETDNKKGDSIIGIWEVKNQYYMAIYEIVKYKNQYYGKIHYYNDGKDEYKGKNSKEDYFLEDVSYVNGKYTIGKMHMPDGSNYQVKFSLKKDELHILMTVDGHPYKEIWKRKKYKSHETE